MITAQDIQDRIQEAFPDAHVAVHDPYSDGQHFEAVVVDESFEGQPRVRQHQAIYAALGDLMQDAIHALALKTSAPSKSE